MKAGILLLVILALQAPATDTQDLSLKGFVQQLLTKITLDPYFGKLIGENAQTYGPIIKWVGDNLLTLDKIFNFIKEPDTLKILSAFGDNFENLNLPKSNDTADIIFAFARKVPWLKAFRELSVSLNNSKHLPTEFQPIIQAVAEILSNDQIWNQTNALYTIRGLLTALNGTDGLPIPDSIRPALSTIANAMSDNVIKAVGIAVEEINAGFPDDGSTDFTLEEFVQKFKPFKLVRRISSEINWGTNLADLVATGAKALEDKDVQASLKVVFKHLGAPDIVSTLASPEQTVDAILSKVRWSVMIGEVLDSGLSQYLAKIRDGPAVSQILRLARNPQLVSTAARLVVPLINSLLQADEPMDGMETLGHIARTYDLMAAFNQPVNLTDMCWKQGHIAIKAMQRSQLWGIRMLDAWGKPRAGIQRGALKWVGSYDECMNISYSVDADEMKKWGVGDPYPSAIKGKACRVDTLPPQALTDKVKESIWLDSEIVKERNETVSMLLCVPAACDSIDLDVLLRDALSYVSFSLEHIECWDEKDHTSPGNYIILAVILAMIAVGLLTTVVDYCVHDDNRKEAYMTDTGNTNQAFELQEFSPGEIHSNYDFTAPITEDEFKRDLKPDKSEKLWLRLIRCFSLRRVLPRLLDGDHSDWSIPALHGLRVMSIAWIMLVHTLAFQAVTHPGMLTISNLFETLDWLRDADMSIYLQGDYSIDTLLVVSAILTSYMFYHGLEENNGRPTCKGVLYYYLHRIWRLTPVYAIILFFAAFTHAGSGPMWPVLAPEDTCRSDWWQNLLYINNLFPTNGSKDVCFKWTWALALVMQFYVVAPIFMFLIYKVVPLGVSFALVGVTGSAIGTAVIYEKIGKGILESNQYYDDVFVKPWTRCSPYLLGLITGYLMFKKRHYPGFNKWLAVIGWVVSIGIITLLVFLPYSELREGGEQWKLWERVLFEAIRRPIWAMAICFMVFACFNKVGGIANSVLSWGGWIPLSRLSFCAFLLHPIVMFMFIYNRRTQIYTDRNTLVLLWGSYMVITYGFAVIFAIFIEIPLRLLERTILFPSK